jgi:hypothetical protein
MSQDSILTDTLSSACWEKKEKETVGGFFPRAGHTCGCATWDFCGFYVQLKADLRVSP